MTLFIGDDEKFREMGSSIGIKRGRERIRARGSKFCGKTRPGEKLNGSVVKIIGARYYSFSPLKFLSWALEKIPESRNPPFLPSSRQGRPRFIHHFVARTLP